MTKKSLFVGSLYLAITTNIIANNSFIGINYGNSKIIGAKTENFQNDKNAYSETIYANKLNTYSLKSGKIFDDHRVYGKYTKIDNSTFVITLNQDQFFTFDDTIKPYIGSAFGCTSIQGSFSDISGLAFGLTFGAIAKISKKISIEMGYDYMFSSADTMDGNDKIELNEYGYFHTGININF